MNQDMTVELPMVHRILSLLYKETREWKRNRHAGFRRELKRQRTRIARRAAKQACRLEA